MTTTQLEYFLAIGDKLNFTKAAEELFVSQSVLSRQISSLEQELGVQLFVRERRGLSFTQAGKVLFTALKPQAKEFRLLIQRVASLGKQEKIHVSIGFADLGMIQPKQKQLVDMLRGPELQADVSIVSNSLDTLISMLQEGTLDFLCLPQFIAEENRETISYFPLTANKICLIYSSACSGVSQHPVSLKDFRDVPIIAALPQHREILTGICRENGFQPLFKPFSQQEIIPNISIQGYAFLTPDWSVLGSGRYDRWFIPGFPEDIDVLAWKTDNLNPAISYVEANRLIISL